MWAGVTGGVTVVGGWLVPALVRFEVWSTVDIVRHVATHRGDYNVRRSENDQQGRAGKYAR